MKTLGVAVALCAIAACACTRISSNTALPGGANPWTVHGVLRIASTRTPDNLVTMLGGQAINTDLSMLWAGYLFDWNDKNEYVPELATAFPTLQNGGISKDGLTITYHLRKGVVWQDGAPFGADDVIFSWHQVLNPRNFVITHDPYDRVTRIDRLDEYTIAIHLKQPYAPFAASFFTMGPNTYAILPKHLLDKLPNINHAPASEILVGTGPFRIASYEPGTRVRFVANPRYWRGSPKLKEIDFDFIPNDNTVLNMLRTGEIDFYLRAAEAQLPVLRAIPGVNVTLSPFTRFADLGFNAGNPELADVRVRQALAFGTDRNALIEKVTHGVDMPADSDQPPFLWAHASGLPQYPYDPARAAALLDAAGWKLGAEGLRSKDGQPLALTMVGFTGSQTVSGTEEVVQQEWKQLGVDVTIKNYPSGLLYATQGGGGIETNGKFDVAVEEWANGTDPDDSLLFLCSRQPPNGWNIYHFCDADFDAAEARASSTYDRTARKAAYAEAQRILDERLPILVIWFVRRVDAYNTDFRNYKPAHAVTPFWNAWEWDI